MARKIIAVDFDGTLFTDNWPDIGDPIWPVIERAREEQARGTAVILWTCRSGAPLRAAVKACSSVGINPDAVNENLPEIIAAWGGEDTRKIVATEYWDDRAVNVRELLRATKSVNDLYDEDGGEIVCAHEFHYDYDLGEAVCQKCGYVPTIEDKMAAHRYAFNRLREEEANA